MKTIQQRLCIYNSLTRKKEPFVPIKPGFVGMYVCGITVYDHCHLGHARSMVNFDMMVRFLRAIGYKVLFVRNITDIDDKIINRAREKKISVEELTEHYIDAMHTDEAALLIQPPDIEPRATGFISSIIGLIERLVALDFAYVSENGDVCYQVSKFNDYGKLSKKDIEGLRAGARVDIAEGKRDPVDFVLWKMAKPGEPSWESPWGRGRPGWHIECSAMAIETLGANFDIHGGGSDLQFPHHENEIAQSEAATQEKFANYWLHVGMLQVNHEKMAKSVGNFYTVQSVLADHNPELIRYFLLSSHYRSALNYSHDQLQAAEKSLARLYQSLRYAPEADMAVEPNWQTRFFEVMSDDFNTPQALSVLFELSHEVNKTKSQQLASTLKQLAGVLGLLQNNPDDFLQASDAEFKAKVEDLIAKRSAARDAKNWIDADRIRDEICALGVELEDAGSGTLWRRKSLS